jgi:RNA polymerase sigma factor (sigma-70 family)
VVNPPAQPAATASARNTIDGLVQSHGDLVFDLCESVLSGPAAAQAAFRSVFKELKRQADRSEGYREHERAWVLRACCATLRQLFARHGGQPALAEQAALLDASAHVSARFKQFERYFRKLRLDEQLVLLMRDKHGLGYSEIAAATGVPEESLKVVRQQALRTLEEWLWARGPSA